MSKTKATHPQQREEPTRQLNLGPVPISLWKEVRAIRALCKKLGKNSSRVAIDLTRCILKHIDRETGEEKPCAECARRTLLTSQLPFRHFFDAIGRDRFSDDADLFRAMDERTIPLWAAASNNACLHVNPALAEYAGHPRENFLGMGWAELMHRADVDRASQDFKDGFATAQNFSVVYRFRRSDGFWGWITDIARPRYDRHGRYVGYVGTMYETSAWVDRAHPPDSMIQSAAASNGHRPDIVVPHHGTRYEAAVLCEMAQNSYSADWSRPPRKRDS